MLSNSYPKQKKEIKKIFIKDIGYITFDPNSFLEENREPIEYYHNSDVDDWWYRQGDKEFNGKYVVMIEYFNH